VSNLMSSNYSSIDTIHELPKKSKCLIEYIKSFYNSFFVPFFFLLIFQVYRTNFISFIKLMQILVRTPLVIIGRLINRFIWKKPRLTSYHIKGTIPSTTTQIFFTRSKLTGIDICMKLWPKRKLGDSSPKDPVRQLEELVEGFTFNRRFAPGVYLGIAPVSTQGEGAQKILRGGLIFKPSIDNLKPGEYVIVMRNVQKNWKLDYRLSLRRSNLRTRKGMRFLAREVARMHKQLESLPPVKTRPDLIALKLAFNIKRFGQGIQTFGDAAMEEKYDYICKVMNTAYNNYRSHFEQRCRDGYIKRCHGDLKTSNLWISPWKIFPRKLFALDCIDFNLDFCHIDTLSDIAMLAVDIQQVMSRSGENDTEELTIHFLEAYCREMRENDVCVQPILKYYMTEKAMVCSYVSILLDDSPELGERYFAIAHLLAKQLEQLLVPPDPVFHSEQGFAMLTN
jgi:aminoglycoside phosphotransferase family enzyme